MGLHEVFVCEVGALLSLWPSSMRLGSIGEREAAEKGGMAGGVLIVSISDFLWLRGGVRLFRGGGGITVDVCSQGVILGVGFH